MWCVEQRTGRRKKTRKKRVVVFRRGWSFVVERRPVCAWLVEQKTAVRKKTRPYCENQRPSLVNWPALSFALLKNIVPDFPLIDKSFNQLYSGNDL